jgi:hypothetical protein
MMEMVKREYLENLEGLSTDLERKHMDPNFWYEQFTLDSDSVHLNNHMIDMVQKYMKGDATQMETYIDLGAVVHEFKHRKGIFARRDLSMKAIRAMHADFYDLPDDTRDATYADSSSKNQIQVLEDEVTINACKQPLQTISPILRSEGGRTSHASPNRPTSCLRRSNCLQTGSLGWRGIPSIARM